LWEKNLIVSFTMKLVTAEVDLCHFLIWNSVRR
jgi:hypothetical protein